VVVIFGAMGWMGVLIDVGSMMTASVALGVAVDDTIHYLTWFRRGLDQGLDRNSAVLAAYERCATAMTQTTLIGGLGLAAFSFSTFTPTQRFGTLMLTLLFAALFGDLIFLPAMLSGPFGRFFRPRAPKPAQVSEEDAMDEDVVIAVPLAAKTQVPHTSRRRRHKVS
jgi:predicted RND superfamily exporter protein